MLAKAKVSATDRTEKFYIYIVFKGGLNYSQDMQNTPSWPPTAKEKKKPIARDASVVSTSNLTNSTNMSFT